MSRTVTQTQPSQATTKDVGTLRLHGCDPSANQDDGEESIDKWIRRWQSVTGHCHAKEIIELTSHPTHRTACKPHSIMRDWRKPKRADTSVHWDQNILDSKTLMESELTTKQLSRINREGLDPKKGGWEKQGTKPTKPGKVSRSPKKGKKVSPAQKRRYNWENVFARQFEQRLIDPMNSTITVPLSKMTLEDFPLITKYGFHAKAEAEVKEKTLLDDHSLIDQWDEEVRKWREERPVTKDNPGRFAPLLSAYSLEQADELNVENWRSSYAEFATEGRKFIFSRAELDYLKPLLETVVNGKLWTNCEEDVSRSSLSWRNCVDADCDKPWCQMCTANSATGYSRKARQIRHKLYPGRPTWTADTMENYFKVSDPKTLEQRDLSVCGTLTNPDYVPRAEQVDPSRLTATQTMKRKESGNSEREQIRQKRLGHFSKGSGKDLGSRNKGSNGSNMSSMAPTRSMVSTY